MNFHYFFFYGVFLYGSSITIAHRYLHISFSHFVKNDSLRTYFFLQINSRIDHLTWREKTFLEHIVPIEYKSVYKFLNFFKEKHLTGQFVFRY